MFLSRNVSWDSVNSFAELLGRKKSDCSCGHQSGEGHSSRIERSLFASQKNVPRSV